MVVHDTGAIDGSPLSILCVNVGTTSNAQVVTPPPAPATVPTILKPMGWVKSDNVWRYYDDNRNAKTGWFNDNGTWYYLNDNGSMASNTVIDGYTLNASGAWI